MNLVTSYQISQSQLYPNEAPRKWKPISAIGLIQTIGLLPMHSLSWLPLIIKSFNKIRRAKNLFDMPTKNDVFFCSNTLTTLSKPQTDL